MLLAGEPIEDPNCDEPHQAQGKHKEFAAGAGLIAWGWGLGTGVWRGRVTLGIHIQGRGYVANWGIWKSLRLSVISTSL